MIREILFMPARKLRRAVEIKAKIERLENQLEDIIIATTPKPVGKAIRLKRRMSAAARRKISTAAKTRWARLKAAAKGR